MIYIYIYRERERERGGLARICVPLHRIIFWHLGEKGGEGCGCMGAGVGGGRRGSEMQGLNQRVLGPWGFRILWGLSACEL